MMLQRVWDYITLPQHSLPQMGLETSGKSQKPLMVKNLRLIRIS